MNNDNNNKTGNENLTYIVATHVGGGHDVVLLSSYPDLNEAMNAIDRHSNMIIDNHSKDLVIYAVPLEKFVVSKRDASNDEDFRRAQKIVIENHNKAEMIQLLDDENVSVSFRKSIEDSIQDTVRNAKSLSTTCIFTPVEDANVHSMSISSETSSVNPPTSLFVLEGNKDNFSSEDKDDDKDKNKYEDDDSSAQNKIIHGRRW